MNLPLPSPPAADTHIAQLAAFCDPHRLWEVPWEELAGLEILPGVTMMLDLWTLPSAWGRIPRHRRASHRNIDFSRIRAAATDPYSPATESVVRRAKRLAAILFTTPITHASGQTRLPSKPTTWVADCKYMVASIAWIVANIAPPRLPGRCPDGPQLFAALSREQFDHWRQQRGIGNFWISTGPKLVGLFQGGVIDDWPSQPDCLKIERRRRGASIPSNPAITRSPWRPFQDDFTARMGKAALFMAEELGPDLLSCLTDMLILPFGGAHGLKDSQAWLDRRATALAEWRGERLKPGTLFPYSFLISAKDLGNIPLSGWPLPSFRSFRTLCALLQTAHWIIVALATAARDSEIAALQRECLTTIGTQELLVGHTFKLSAEAGERRHWPLPKVAVAAIEQQRRLADILAPERQSSMGVIP